MTKTIKDFKRLFDKAMDLLSIFIEEFGVKLKDYFLLEQLVVKIPEIISIILNLLPFMLILKVISFAIIKPAIISFLDYLKVPRNLESH